jgi:hypothetical protein
MAGVVLFILPYRHGHPESSSHTYRYGPTYRRCLMFIHATIASQSFIDVIQQLPFFMMWTPPLGGNRIRLNI